MARDPVPSSQFFLGLTTSLNSLSLCEDLVFLSSLCLWLYSFLFQAETSLFTMGLFNPITVPLIIIIPLGPEFLHRRAEVRLSYSVKMLRPSESTYKITASQNTYPSLKDTHSLAFSLIHPSFG